MDDMEWVFYDLVDYLVYNLSKNQGISEEEAMKKVKAYLKKRNLL